MEGVRNGGAICTMGVWAAGQVKERERDLRKNALSLINANLFFVSSEAIF